jgi:hypothetical protein
MVSPPGQDANTWFIRKFANRTHNEKYETREFPSFPVAHRASADLVSVAREKSCTFEYDFKRRPVTPTEKTVVLSGGGEARLLNLNTIPWQTVAEFNTTRKLFEDFRHKSGGMLKTLADWERWERFQSGTMASQSGVRRKADAGPSAQALQIFRRAFARRQWGIQEGCTAGTYREAAEALTEAGFPTKVQDFKNAKLRGDGLPEGTIPPGDPEVAELRQAILSIWPEFEWARMVAGGAAAGAKQAFCAGFSSYNRLENKEGFLMDNEVSWELTKPSKPVADPETRYASPSSLGLAGYSVAELEAGWGFRTLGNLIARLPLGVDELSEVPASQAPRSAGMAGMARMAGMA